MLVFARRRSNYWNNLVSQGIFHCCVSYFLPVLVISLLYPLAYFFFELQFYKQRWSKTTKQKKNAQNVFLDCVFSPAASPQHHRTCLHFLYFLSGFFSSRLSCPLSFVELVRPLLECEARCESSLIIICPPQQSDNCSRLHLSIVSSTGRSEEFPSPPGATPCCLCSSPSPASPAATEACHVSAGSCCSALVFNKSSYVCEGRVEGTDNNNHYYSPSKGYLAFTGALTDRSLTRSRGQVLCL